MVAPEIGVEQGAHEQAQEGVHYEQSHEGAQGDDALSETPEMVLAKCARRLNMTRGILVVRRGSEGSYVYDTSAPLPGKIFKIPTVQSTTNYLLILINYHF